MKLIKTTKDKVLKVYNAYWAHYIGEVNKMSLLLDTSYNQIGSAESEVFSSKKDAVQFLYDTIHEVEGKLEMRNRDLKLELKSDTLILINETCDLYALTNNAWVFYSKFRASTLLQEGKEGWKITHQHSSFPDMKTDEGKNVAIHKIAEENIVLRDAIKRRTYELEQKNRELEVEGALERVRSRSMAMQKSEELKEVILEVLKKLQGLGISMEERTAAIFTYEAGNKDYEQWVASPEYTSILSFNTPYFDHPVQNDIWNARQNGTDFYAKPYSVEVKNSLFKFLFDLQALKHMPKVEKTKALKFKHYGISIAFQKHAAVVVVDHSGIPLTESENSILIRLSKVFTQTYTRFLDLKKAEAQTREAQIEAALEKVRSRSLAMHNPEELQEVVAVVAKKLKELGVIFDAGGVILCTYFPNNKDVMHWIAADDFSYSGNYLVPYFENPIFDDAWDSKIRGDAYFSKGFSKEDKNSFFKHCFEHSDYKKFPAEFKQHALQAEKHHLSAAWSKNSAIIIPSLNGIVPSENDAETLTRFAKVFEQAYIRFLDLKKAEQQTLLAEQNLIKLKTQKQRAEEALSKLQQTQKQLIQSEKMASLGELTAGIAHEIQNPLNFVNNFSEVSKELLEEMLEEMANGELEEVKAIATDISQNLEKINHHGKRADGIVKGMLQHSRSSTGTKEPTNINSLADEYLRLAYQGLRAKDKSFNATLETDFDESIGRIDIIPQDMGRVILNLITNAFYAVNDKKKSLLTPKGGTHKAVAKYEPYEPKVSVSTNKRKDTIEISVKDNGNGIPAAIVDKIFQPFFTTKPTGQGTGLGLSMSYDIVTKGHGGELKVETNQGTGTIFIIYLPIQNKVHADAIKKSQI